MISATCPQCHYQFGINESFAGKNWPCPSCGTTFTLTLPSPVEREKPSPPTLPTVSGGQVLDVSSATNENATAAGQGSPDISVIEVHDRSERQEPLVVPPAKLAADATGESDDSDLGGAENPPVPDSFPASQKAESLDQSILQSFPWNTWKLRAERNLFISFPAFLDEILTIKPILTGNLHTTLDATVKRIRHRWEDAKNRRGRVYPAEQGFPEFAALLVQIAAFFYSLGEFSICMALCETAKTVLFLVDSTRQQDKLIEAVSLEAMAKLHFHRVVRFENVVDRVRKEAQALRVPNRKIVPLPEETDRVIADICYRFYKEALNRAEKTGDQSGMRELVTASLPYVSRLLIELAKWAELKEWVHACENADAETVSLNRDMGLLVENDPMSPPPKETRDDVVHKLQNNDIEGAVEALLPWQTEVAKKTRSALPLLLAYRTPESDFLVIGNTQAPPEVLKPFSKAITAFRNGETQTAITHLQRLPSDGDVLNHPLVLEWRALLQASAGMRAQAEPLFRQAVQSGELLDDTVWNLCVMLAQGQTPEGMNAAFEVIREHVKRDKVRVYSGRTYESKAGRDILRNAATSLALVALGLNVNGEAFIVDLVVEVDRRSPFHDRLLPFAFVLAHELRNPNFQKLKDELLAQWITGRKRREWPDPRKELAPKELERFLQETASDVAELKAFAEYMEERKKYHKHWPMTHRLLADIYKILRNKDQELGARISLALTTAGLFDRNRMSEDYVRDDVRQAFALAKTCAPSGQIAQLSELKSYSSLKSLAKWLTTAGKRNWVADYSKILIALEEPALVTEKPEREEDRGTSNSPQIPQPASDPRPATTSSRDAVRDLRADAEVDVEFFSDALVISEDETEIVVRIANRHAEALEDLELWIEFDDPSVVLGSQMEILQCPIPLRVRSASQVSYETVPVLCGPRVAKAGVVLTLTFSVLGQRRYRSMSLKDIPAVSFPDLTKRAEGIPHGLYCFGGLVPQSYAHVYKGRDKVRQQIIQQAVAGSATHFLDGIKRVGKSSVCANLEYDRDSRVVAVHLDLEKFALGDEKTTTIVFCQSLLREIAERLRSLGFTPPEAISAEKWEKEPATILFLKALQDVSRTLSGLRLLLMFDEVQTLLAAVEANQRGQDPNRYVRRDFLDMLSAMLNDSNRPAQLLFTASERFERVKATGFHNLFNRLTPIALGFLDAAATGAILSAAVGGTGIRYTPEAIKSVWSYLRGYPAQVQQVGAKCMGKLASKHRNIVIPQDVEEVASSLIEDSVLFDYQCNRETIDSDEAFVLEAIFRGQESIHGKERALGMGVPIAKLPMFAPAVERVRLPPAIANLRNHQVVVQEYNDKGELVIRVSGLLLELWLGRLRAVRGDLRPETFPEKRPSVFEASADHLSTAPDRTGCALWIDFENVAKSDALRKRFLDIHVDPKAVAADFVNRLEQACRREGLVVKDRRVVAPWTIPELMPYMGAFAAKGFQPEICVAGLKNAADAKIMIEIQQKTSAYTGTLGIGTLLLITADNDFATTLMYAKTAGLRAMVWGAWQRPSRDLKTNADKVGDLVTLLYSVGTSNSTGGQGAFFHSDRRLDQAIRFALAPNGGDQWSHNELDKTEVALRHNEQLCNWLGVGSCDGESAKALLCPTSGRGWDVVPAYDEYTIKGQILIEACRKLGIPLSCDQSITYRLPVQPGLPFLLSLADLYGQMAKCTKTFPPNEVKLSREKGVHTLSLILRSTGQDSQPTNMDDFERRYTEAISGVASGGHETAKRLSSLRLARLDLEYPAGALQQSFFNGVKPGTEKVAVAFLRSPTMPAVEVKWTTKEP